MCTNVKELHEKEISAVSGGIGIAISTFFSSRNKSKRSSTKRSRKWFLPLA